MQNIVAVVFKTESEGFQAITELRNQPVDEKAAILQMALVKKSAGGLEVCDQFDSGLSTTDDMALGGLMGGLIGILGGPIGVLLMGSYGMLVGSLVDTGDAMADAAMIEKVAGKLIEGENALIILAEEDDEAVLDGRLSKYDAEIARFDAAVIAAEIEEAAKAEYDLQHQLRAQLRAEKREDFKKAIADKRDKLNAEFQKIKESIKS